MGPHATSYFVDLVLELCRDRGASTDQDYPDFLVDYASSTIDRTEAIKSDNLDGLRTQLLARIDALIEQGCPQVVLPCITAHAALRDAGDRPVLDVPALVSMHVELEHPGKRIGVLATSGTLISGMVPVMLGESAIVPDEALQERVMAVIYEAVKAARPAGDQLDEVAGELIAQGAQAILAGCTEVEMALARSTRIDVPLVMPLQLAAAVLTA